MNYSVNITEWNDEEFDISLPVGRLRRKDLDVGPEEAVDEGVGADEGHPHARWTLCLSVTKLLDLGDEAGERGLDVGGPCCADDAVAALCQLCGQVGTLSVTRVGQDHLIG